MKFDILMILLLLYGIIFCMGAVGGAQLHTHSPETNITAYADSRIDHENLNITNIEKIEANYEGRSKEMVHAAVVFFVETSRQTFASGIEFGFENAWVGPLPFAILAAFLALVYALQGHLDWLLIPVAILILIKEFAVEKFARWNNGTQR